MKFVSTLVFFLLFQISGSPAFAAGSFVISTDGTEVTDSKTGLIWRRCVEGMSWNGTTCSGTAATYTQQNALLRAASEASSTGLAWRVPDVKTLSGIADRTYRNAAIDKTVFPATPTTVETWSSTPFAYDPTIYAWVVNFYHGTLLGKDRRTSLLNLRLVRGP